MTVSEFYAILGEKGIDPSIVRIDDTVTDCVFFVNKNYNRYEVGFRERGTVFEPKSFTEMDEALNYLLKRIEQSYYPTPRDRPLNTLPREDTNPFDE